MLLATAAASFAEPPATSALPVARVRVTVHVVPAVDGLAAEALRARVAAALQRATPPVELDAAAEDLLHVRVALEPRSATHLRGFWLPFSGTYAIGLVGLALERPVLVAGATAPVPAIVWRQDRVVATSWREAAAEVHRAIAAMLDAFLGARAGP